MIYRIIAEHTRLIKGCATANDLAPTARLRKGFADAGVLLSGSSEFTITDIDITHSNTANNSALPITD